MNTARRRAYSFRLLSIALAATAWAAPARADGPAKAAADDGASGRVYTGRARAYQVGAGIMGLEVLRGREWQVQDGQLMTRPVSRYGFAIGGGASISLPRLTREDSAVFSTDSATLGVVGFRSGKELRAKAAPGVGAWLGLSWGGYASEKPWKAANRYQRLKARLFKVNTKLGARGRVNWRNGRVRPRR